MISPSLTRELVVDFDLEGSLRSVTLVAPLGLRTGLSVFCSFEVVPFSAIRCCLCALDVAGSAVSVVFVRLGSLDLLLILKPYWFKPRDMLWEAKT